MKHSRVVLASVFTDSIGNRDNNLYSRMHYAELSTPGTLDFAALGGLPHGYRLDIWLSGRKPIRSNIARSYKGDVGYGGPARPKLDLHAVTAHRLKVSAYSFLGRIRISHNRCY